MELIEVVEVAARHSLAAHDELRAEGHVESDKHQQTADAAPVFRVHSAGHLGPPVMDAADESNHGAAHHYIVKVGHYEIGVGEVNIHRESRKEESGQTADGEQEQERKGVQHGR